MAAGRRLAGDGADDGEGEDGRIGNQPGEDDACGEDRLGSWMDGPPPGMLGLPQGLRIRRAQGGGGQPQSGLACVDDPAAALPAFSGRERWLLGIACVMCLLMTAHFWFRRVVPATEPWRQGCRQCSDDWWGDFWRWRLGELRDIGADGRPRLQPPPEGMEWEWGNRSADTDWFNASAELVRAVVLPHLDPAKSGPVLQIGCGDSPLPALLHQAGFRDATHIDIAPQVVEAMRERYPAADWPGVRFERRDFMAAPAAGGGAPPPAGGYWLVVDKAGIWDWLQEEAPAGLPVLLDRVHGALVPPPQRGLYVVVTKQNPGQLAAALARVAAAAPGGAGGRFAVEASRPLGSSGLAWAYVLVAL
ncbi:unnamed protein product [Prorocentrum cordatum]|uniref:Methyltransferase domain-containing protein n=1 Tax=Prorocentrum cordatum TaxID=2364126 RepID=A0ABN9V621_9DINO|nr:unnamed protein product [Polarella glacialis]